METTMTIAKLLGPIMLFLGIGLLFSSGYYKKLVKSFGMEKGAMLMGGIAGIILGLLIIGNHNAWSNFSEIVISIIGWAMFLKGAMIVALPKVFSQLTENIKYSKGLLQAAGIVYILIGIYFTQGAYM